MPNRHKINNLVIILSALTFEKLKGDRTPPLMIDA